MVGQYGRVEHSCDCGELWWYQTLPPSLPPSLPPPHLGDTERVGGMNINMVSCFYQSMRPLNILLIKI